MASAEYGNEKSQYASDSSTSPPRYVDEPGIRKGFPGLIDSFKRNPNAAVTPKGTVGADGHVFDSEAAAHATANSPLERSLKSRHLQMIAIGGSIGTGLFVGAGSALSTGGPAALIIAYGLIGCMLYCTVHALGELAVLYPVAGSFSAYSTRFLDPAWGFAMGWNYAMQWLVVLPLEIVAASLTVRYWRPDLNSAIFVTPFLIVIVMINLFGVKGYGEAEFVFSIIKIIAVIGFIILGIIINTGGVPGTSYIGNRYWQHPGAFAAGFKGVCSVFVNAAFAFAGTELVGLAAAETANPRKTLPTAVKQVFWRISLFYLVSLTIIGLLVPYDDPLLLQKTSSADANASPFVIAIKNAGISVLPSIFNVVILIAVLSVGNSSIYGASRTMAALADQGQAPRILGYIDRKGRPLVGILIASAFGILSYLAASADHGTTAFNWLLGLSGLSSIFTWGSICLAHIRFRHAWKKNGHSLDELAFKSQPGVIGSWIGFIFNCLVLIAQFWVGVWPLGWEDLSKSEVATNFFQAYLAAPIVILFYLGYKIYRRTPIMRSSTIDLVSGRRELDLTQIIAEERAEKAAWPLWKRWYKVVC